MLKTLMVLLVICLCLCIIAIPVNLKSTKKLEELIRKRNRRDKDA